MRGRRTHWISWSKLEVEEGLGASWRTLDPTSPGQKGLGKDPLPRMGCGGPAVSRPGRLLAASAQRLLGPNPEFQISRVVGVMEGADNVPFYNIPRKH